MIFKTLGRTVSCLLVFFTVGFSFAQTTGLSDEQFTDHLKSYVDKLLVRYGEKNIEKERFLVQQIRFINEEIKNRVGNVSEKRSQYFDKLEDRLAEIRALKSRLPASSGQLYSFIEDLETRIQKTIDDDVMDYTRHRVFDDAIQLLYLAEELIKLDPSTNLSANKQISEGISKTNQKIVGSFGTDESTRSIASGKSKSSIFDVYKEWQKNERIKYHLRYQDIQEVKNRLVLNATVADLQRMFRLEVRQAAQAYNFLYYELAELSFEEILKSYQQIGQLDDILYYQAECNFRMGRYNKAKELFDDLISNYPSSDMASEIYIRLIEIDNHFENYGDALNHFRRMQNIISTGDEYYQEALMLAINAAINGKFYEEAVSISYEITPQSPLYSYSKFAQVKALTGARNFEDANTVLQEILKTPNLEPQFRFDILAKLGFIQYELGDPGASLNYFDQIGAEYSNYDRVLMGYGWTFYRMELDKTINNRNFENAKKYINLLIDSYANSEYLLEAHSLLGYINQLEFDTGSAIDNFSYTYGAKDTKVLSDDLLVQEGELKVVLNEAGKLEAKALQQGNKEVFNRAVNMRKKVEEPLFKLKYADLSPVGMAAKNEVTKLRGQINELERLKQLAVQKNDDTIVDRIEEMQVKIYRAINSYPVEVTSTLGFNFFDEHPLARKESIVESENEKLQKMREDSQKERENLISKISQLDVEISNAKSRGDDKRLLSLEISRERFIGLLNSMDYMDTYVYSMKKKDTYIDLNRWSDYGAFGMANVNFALRSYQKDQIGAMQNQIQKINELLIKRKENIEHTIRSITNEISLMTRRVRKQERIREREELSRQFEESYFDTHETEDDAQNNAGDNTIPPSFDDENE